jgi:uncharacterized protein YndB with AHSA1/START domain
MSDRSTEHATFVIERTYDAAPERVFGAWASKEAKLAWFGPRDNASEGYELDFRIEGQERFAVTLGAAGPAGPPGTRYTYIATYQDIVPEERIVYTYEMYKDDDRISVSVSTVELLAAEGGTALTYTEQGVFLDGHDTAAAREHGTREILETLASALEAQGVGRA